MRLCRLGEDLGIMGRWGETLEAGDEPCLGQRNFRTDPRSRGEAAGVRHPDVRALYRYVTAIHVELPGHEPRARRGSQPLDEVTEPLFSSYLPADPYAAVDVGLKDKPHAGTKAASSAA
jgi:hypothetical protein